MNMLELKTIIEKYDLNKYISLLKGHSYFDKEYANFYVEKCKFLWRLDHGFKNKYIVFENHDIEYGKVKKEKTFKNIDDACDYLWALFVEFVTNSNDRRLKDILSKISGDYEV